MVTTEEPVFSTALVTKDFFELILNSLNFGLGNGCDNTLNGNKIPNDIAEESKN